MEPLSTTALTAIAKAVGAEAGKLVARGVKARVLDERALEKALGRAYEQVQTAHGVRLRATT
ncbi:hypothetical protein OHA21_04585 [Actinoplanes sp. NBC_00393]|uniref:hypothetical protein n=1 Tax=Actinoplanes sp. NBC_00393 TaxID=2975953 RepID=UPI002E22602D